MKNIFAKRFFSKILAVFLSVCIMTFSGALLVFAGWEHGASNDVLIQILGGTDGKGGYRYSVDIIYYSMAFSFNVRSYEVNTQTGETYITSGVWFMDENKKADVELYVENHADTPISVTAFIDQADFDECNTRVLREGLQREYLPAGPAGFGQSIIFSLFQPEPLYLSSSEEENRFIPTPSFLYFKYIS